MSQANVELVQRGFEHFVATGEPAWETLHEHVEVDDHDIMDGREYRGHADVRRWLYEDWAAAWSDYSAEPQEFIEADDEPGQASSVDGATVYATFVAPHASPPVFRIEDAAQTCP